MATRIEVLTKNDSRAWVKLKKIKSANFPVEKIELIDVYTIDKELSANQLKKAQKSLSNPVTQSIGTSLEVFDFAIEVGFLPGVTDNVGHTAKEIIEDLLKIKFSPNEAVYTSQVLLIVGKLSGEKVSKLAESLINPLIERIYVKNYSDYKKDGGMDISVPRVTLKEGVCVIDVDLNLPDEELIKIGKLGISNTDGTRRGPLALELSYMKVIQEYFKKQKRNPTDIELETLAQTWSEHCKHTIFSNPLDEVKEGLFKTYIKGATERINSPLCVSVFTDNSGAIDFDKDYLITHKAETHNSPSALDPFGGAITGIVGVNRDALGFGLGAKPIINTYGFMFGDPDDNKPLFRDPNLTDQMLSPRRIMEGVIEGVNAGGNQSGIPTPQGFVYFDNRYKGKPIVFCGTVGLIPKKINGKPAHIKKASKGDFVVMIGGRVGLDGIHGATFSSEALTLGSPDASVQIGDPITQKKFSDVIVREARNMNLYSSITDNGAGGLSSSVGEMARESGGAKIYLDKVPLKYPGLDPWQIWISESQERMTLAVPKNKWAKFERLMFSRGVEATKIGEFTNSGKVEVFYQSKKIVDLDLEFLHNGLPKIEQKSRISKNSIKQPSFAKERDLSKDLLNLLSRKNIASFEFISTQYDHDVQGGSVLKPLVGAGRVNSEVSIMRPILLSQKGVVLSQGYYPSYSDMDTYSMAAACIDTAVRNVIIAGASPSKIALLDNFSWCSSNEPERLWQLKRAVKACYDTSVAYKTPFISGKDSMFNDFKGFDEDGNPLKISIPPTLIISSIGIIDDISKTVSFDLKNEGDLIYSIGETFKELGGSEYFMHLSGDDPLKVGNGVPKVNTSNFIYYKKLAEVIRAELISAGVAVTRGGLGVALAKMAMAGKLGAEITLTKDYELFSESAGRFVVAVNPLKQKEFEGAMKGTPLKRIGKVAGAAIKIKAGEQNISVSLGEALIAYRKTFKGYI